MKVTSALFAGALVFNIGLIDYVLCEILPSCRHRLTICSQGQLDLDLDLGLDNTLIKNTCSFISFCGHSSILKLLADHSLQCILEHFEIKCLLLTSNPKRLFELTCIKGSNSLRKGHNQNSEMCTRINLVW